METQLTTRRKRGLHQSDCLLVFGLFMFYGICILGCIAATYWGLNRAGQTASANATSAAFPAATRQANATATAVARATDQPHFGYSDQFYGDTGRWPVGRRDNEFWTGSVDIKDGAYVWDVESVKQTFIWPEVIPIGEKSKDFDVAFDTKFVQGNQGEVCSGLLFRQSPEGWRSSVYGFSICNDSHYEAHYYAGGDIESFLGWGHNKVISNSDWNHIQVSARKNHFTFTVNDEIIYEMTDNRQKMGGLELFIDVRGEKPAVILFDNFKYGSHPETP